MKQDETKTRQDEDETRQDKTRQDKSRQDKTRQDKTRKKIKGKARQRPARVQVGEGKAQLPGVVHYCGLVQPAQVFAVVVQVVP